MPLGNFRNPFEFDPHGYDYQNPGGLRPPISARLAVARKPIQSGKGISDGRTIFHDANPAIAVRAMAGAPGGSRLPRRLLDIVLVLF